MPGITLAGLTFGPVWPILEPRSHLGIIQPLRPPMIGIICGMIIAYWIIEGIGSLLNKIGKKP